MTKDFANRGRAGKSATTQKTRAAAKTRSARATPTRGAKGRGFHGLSFSSGAIFGAIVVLAAAYLPEWLPGQSESQTTSPEKTVSTPTVKFEFPDVLKNTEIQVDTSPYAGTATSSTTEPNGYAVQAASFREKGDANEMRAKLILHNLPAQVVVKESPTGTWYRVTLGPFERRVDADRTLTKLREQGVSGIIVK